MQFFVFIWRNLLRRPVRSGLTIVGLAVAVAAVVALVGISDGFSRQFQELYDHRGVDLVVQKVGSSAELNNGVPEAMGNRIKELMPGATVMGGLMDVVSFPDHDLMAVIINGWPADSPLFLDRKLISGRFPKEGDRHKAIIGTVLAANLGKKLGDTIRIYDTDVEIIGTFESTSVFESGSIATLLKDMQEFMNRSHQVTGFIVRTDIPKDAPDREAKIAQFGKRIEETLDDGIAAMPATAFIENVGLIKLAKAVAWVTSAIAMAIGAIGMLNTMVMSVYERVREIGTLRAIGWRKMRVMWMILCESILLSFGGAVIGSIAAVGLTRFLSKMPMTSELIEGKIAPVIFAEGFLLAMLVGFLGALYPAYWGANLRPIEAMRRK
ncbi:MAG TPA: ABC transporter permease [Pirellulales bacterium]|jgi:putative ABC transport system permease protein|nr:ABC transporter permease [Pirellulales bacterium]